MTVRYFDGVIQAVKQPGVVLLDVEDYIVSELDGLGALPIKVEIIPDLGPMHPASLSASAALKFELCEAGYRADYIDRVPELAGSAGNLGSACHEALEFWVASGQYLKFKDEPLPVRQKAMAVIWEMCYWNYFSDKSFYKQGWEMLLKWVQRENWNGRTVMECEVKKSFDIQTSRGPLKFNYILDRKDRLDNGEIEVVDYKSVARPISPADLEGRIQGRAYALAMLIEHKDENLPGVWVTFDLLRYEQVSVFFTRDQCAETYRYLQALAERIYASDGTKETLNAECRFCTRKNVCATLQKHEQFGGVLSIKTLEEATDRLAVLENKKGGLDSAIREVQELALTMAEDAEVLEWTTGDNKAKVTAKGRREIDSERLAQIVGPEIMSRYGNVGITAVDKILKEENLTASQQSEIKQLITKRFGRHYVEVKPKSPLSNED